MHMLIKWFGILTGAAAITIMLFTAFSHLFTPDTVQLKSAPKTTSSVVVFNKGASEKELIPYIAKSPVRYIPLNRPVPLDTCYYPVMEIPEQSPLITEMLKPNFEFSKKLDLFSITLRDPPACRDRVPLAPRATPVMPNSATKSGHCNIAFQYDEKGRYINVKPISCSEDIFANPSIEAIQQWHDWCDPEGGFDTALIRETVITYKLSDENGDIIPE